MAKQTFFDRALGSLAPRWNLRRIRAKVATDLLLRNYEGAASGRRTQGWRRTSADANLATAPFLGRLRDVARDLVRNNAYAESALATIVDHTVGTGIVAKAEPRNVAAQRIWLAWANSTDCDADGRCDFAGLQKMVMRTIAESGEVLVRRRLRRPTDGLHIPMQLQVLEPDYLDTTMNGITLANGGRIVYGVEYSPIGERVAFWLFKEHPGNSSWPTTSAQRVPAESVLHIFKPGRPGAARGASWFAPVILRFKDFDEYEDATLMKQKIAACLAVITSDTDGTGAPLGTADDTKTPGIDSLEPGGILNLPPGQTVSVVQPPSVTDYEAYTKVNLRAIATGLGVSYEDLTGDYTGLPYSAARMSRIRHWARVDDWRWRMLVPQFCDPVWGWAMQAAAIMGEVVGDAPQARWTAPPMPMLEPDKEGLAIARNIRAGIKTISGSIRELGEDPEEFFAELAADNKQLDALGLILDSDGRNMTQAGQLQGKAAAAFKPAPAAPAAPTPLKPGTAAGAGAAR